jgi:hypothetical protein
VRLEEAIARQPFVPDLAHEGVDVAHAGMIAR